MDRAAAAYRYIFDDSVDLTEGKALVWDNGYVYTSGSCYARGAQYIGYSCYESRTSGYIDSPVDISKVEANELFYVDSSTTAALGTTVGLKLMGDVTYDAIVTDDASAESSELFAKIATEFNEGNSTVLVVGVLNRWPFNNKYTYGKTGEWNNMISSTIPVSAEPENPNANDVYYKSSGVEWGSVTAGGIVTYDGSTWSTIQLYQYTNYISGSDVSNTLFTNATTAGILNEFQPTQLYQEESVDSLVANVSGNSDFANVGVSAGKRHYIEVNGV